jgi:hypothetical protein
MAPRGAGAPAPSPAELAAARSRHAELAVADAAAASAALHTLSGHDATLLATLRSGLRRWRLDLADWEDLADILVARHRATAGKRRSGGGDRVGKPGAVAAGQNDPAIAKLALRVLLRGKLYAGTPATRRNPHARAALEAGVAALSAEDTVALLAKWQSLDDGMGERAEHRIARYGALQPAEPYDEAQARLFVAAGLTQVRRFILIS